MCVVVHKVICLLIETVGSCLLLSNFICDMLCIYFERREELKLGDKSGDVK